MRGREGGGERERETKTQSTIKHFVNSDVIKMVYLYFKYFVADVAN